MAKYKVGDKVIVRTDLNDDDKYYMDDKSDYWYCDGEMLERCGTVVTIKAVHQFYYLIEEGDGDDYWADEMFEGLAKDSKEEPKYKFKVGDMVIGNSLANTYSITKEGWIGTVTEVNKNTFTAVNEQYPHGFYLVYDKFDLYKPSQEPSPEPTVVNFNITVNLYENACWYCRKGGLVDLYLAGAMGICPSCGRVCNDTRGNYNGKVIEFKSPKKNGPLTTEELEGLPDGTKVYVVWVYDVETGGRGEKIEWGTSGWGEIKDSDLRWEKGNWQPIKDNGRCFDAYLEKPDFAPDSK